MDYKTNGVCAHTISYDIDGTKVKNVTFQGGCHGNLQAVGKLVEGMEITDVINKLQGICCGRRNTSCTDQLTKALSAHI